VRELLLWDSEDINFRSDITGTFDRKVAALGCHKSQMAEIARSLGTPDLETWLKPLCESLAEDERFDLAEAFHRVEVMR
jgi:LmbE family N-acetylglucosaminyl deacetylase